jgi:predicted outer membrane lipoprotein
MAVEGLTTLALLAQQPVGVSWFFPWIGAVLLAVALGCTVFLSVPLHAKMATNPDALVGAKLVATNWPRTIAWSLRAVVCVVMVAQMVNGL